MRRSKGLHENPKFRWIQNNWERYFEKQALEIHLEKFEVTPLDAVKHFPTLICRQFLKRFLARTELFKMSLELMGNIAELAILSGLSAYDVGNFLEAYAFGYRTKAGYSFDNWSVVREFWPQDGPINRDPSKVTEGFHPGRYKDKLLNVISIL